MEGNSKSKKHEEQQSAKENQLIDRTLDDANKRVKDCDEREILQNSEPCHDPETCECIYTPLQVIHQLAYWTEHLWVSISFRGQVWLISSLQINSEMDAHHHEEQYQNDNIAQAPEVCEKSQSVLPQQPHHINEEQEMTTGSADHQFEKVRVI
mmetsp:Transcript_102703/g.162382  ORF Transcript_102703/g.162382 Transcript_102703/m.162382 type:complete len:153 (+) Transcript_102703:1190-1648(+)